MNTCIYCNLFVNLIQTGYILFHSLKSEPDDSLKYRYKKETQYTSLDIDRPADFQKIASPKANQTRISKAEN